MVMTCACACGYVKQCKIYFVKVKIDKVDEEDEFRVRVRRLGERRRRRCI